jgi:hypothetical protein
MVHGQHHRPSLSQVLHYLHRNERLPRYPKALLTTVNNKGAINAKARSRSTKAQTKANKDTDLLLANYDHRDDIEVYPAELPEEKKLEASGNNTEQGNRNHRDVLAFAKAYL